MLDDILLRIISRYPTASELRIVVEEFRQQKKPGGPKIQDIVWSLWNAVEHQRISMQTLMDVQMPPATFPTE